MVLIGRSYREKFIKLAIWLGTIYYEVKETATLFELALWKAKIDQSRRVTRSTRYANHSEYRIEVPGPVKDLILQYAYPHRDADTPYNQIFIKCSRGDDKVYTIDTNPSDTIMDIKNKIRDLHYIPADRQVHLRFDRVDLEDDRTLFHYNIQMESYLYMLDWMFSNDVAESDRGRQSTNLHHVK